jgi:hypothetical protein
MSFRFDTYTGGEHYWIRVNNGSCEVRRETYESEPDNETVFRGSYEACIDWILETKQSNIDYDLNL